MEIPTTAGTLRVSFHHRYGKIPLDREAELQAAASGDFDRFFKRTVALKVKKEVDAGDASRRSILFSTIIRAPSHRRRKG